MTRTASLALASALLLSAATAFALPPNQAAPSGYAGADDYRLERISDVEMAAVQGRGLLNSACTLAVKGSGAVVYGLGVVLRHPFGQGAGLFLMHNASAICA